MLVNKQVATGECLLKTRHLICLCKVIIFQLVKCSTSFFSVRCK